MKKLLTVVFIFMACVAVSCAYAEDKPFQASLTPGIAIYPQNTRINGLTLNIWGENPQSALAIGFVNGSSGASKGLSLGLVNYAENYTGVEWGTVNYATGNFKGWQHGVVNYAGKLTGLQLGLINYAETAESGLQIGLVNIISQNRWFSELPNEFAKGMILVNWRF